MSIQTTISPHNQQPYVSRTHPLPQDLDATIQKAAAAQKEWAAVPLEKRIAIGRQFTKEIEAMKEDIPLELTLQMGRPVSQGAGEVRGLLERSNYLLDIAASSLADVSLADTDKPGFKRYIKRVPLGVVFVIAPWNFPYLTTVNSVIPAIIAGNAVLLKPSPQTPITAERFAIALTRAGLPENVLQVLHLSPELASNVIKHPSVNFVSFTGSVAVGRVIAETAAKADGFTGSALELGGKDPAYVAPDADLDYTAAELVDGAFFNSGQSCCAIERIYVHEAVYEQFVAKVVDITKKYRLGDPTSAETNLGPVVSLASAEKIRKQVADAVKQGAKVLVPEDLFAAAQAGTAFVAPQVLVDVDHTMDVMTEETFGPVIGIQKVKSDDEAIALMNDSRYGLTASVWTNVEANLASEETFLKFVDKLETGTVFLNRCDYLDPALSWVGVKNSGRGVSLSKFGYDQLTRPKSVHMKIKTST
ncbi:hypothetical protein EST38_g9298 [Candolleomyces aberdarensis]|uniref:Aldehyde dehydrogenase domain-containing protein n=1 Tax=Candolleomyces aberdarensis TaxID=2316362 RepID=A0A4Q2DD81_9AGAR|nr:hypothetical protein EST38_g9298 [Candolleomyces aberdarensis]